MGRLAVYKGHFLNSFVANHAVQTVVELGCGDGQQASLFYFPNYTGVDISAEALDLCRRRLSEKPGVDLVLYDERFDTDRYRSEMSISLDVLYHLVEDDVYRGYLRSLFDLATRYVVIYSSDRDEITDAPHVRHRPFTTDIDDMFPEWELVHTEPQPFPYDGDQAKGSFAQFVVYRHRDATPSSRFEVKG